MATLMDVVSDALTAIGQLGQGQTPSPEDGAQGLRQANLIISQATTKRLMLYWVAIRQYSLSQMVADYTIGPSGATFTAPRPTIVESGQANIPGSNVWLPVSMLDKPKWDALINKGAYADIPERLYVEYTYPNLTFHVDPKPIGSPQIKLGAWEPLTKFTSLFDTVNFPDPYEEWLTSALIVKLAPYYDQPVPANLVDRATKGELAVMQYNAQTLGGALGADQLLNSPNVGQPIPPGSGGGQ